jgi:flagellar biosynthetic protein FliR
VVYRLDLVDIMVVLVVAARAAVLVGILPFMDHRGVPLLWRIALAGLVAVAAAPAVRAGLPSGFAPSWGLLVIEMLRSLVVGALLAFAVGIPLTAVQFAGHIIGVQIGFAIVNTIDPQSGAQVSVLDQLYYLLAVMIFFALDAHHVMLAGIVSTCTVLPPFAPLDVAATAWLLVRECAGIFRIGLQIAAPCVIVLLLVSATMGIVVKTVPQLNVLVVGFPLRIAVGLLTLGLGLVFFRDIAVSLAGGLEGELQRVLLALS